MDRRYQVFISSTFKDLVAERRAVLEGILEIDHIPAGMELFPASDETAWDLIKGVIDDSDYYVVIVGGKYGSTDSEGIGYTEKEYDYAAKQGKPIIPLLCKSVDDLPRGKTEPTDEAMAKLLTFRKKVQDDRHCKYWSSAAELKAHVITGITKAIRTHPAVGWVRADSVPNDATVADLLKLRQRIQQLEEEQQDAATRPPPNVEDLQQGDDVHRIRVSFSYYSGGGATDYELSAPVTWNEIFAAVAPSLIQEGSERVVHTAIKDLARRRCIESFREIGSVDGERIHRFRIESHELDSCVVQLRAIGLIKESTRKRALSDTQTYWTLTPFGDNLMTRLRAIKRLPMQETLNANREIVVMNESDDDDDRDDE